MTFEEAIEDIRHLPFERMHSFDANFEWLGSSDGNEIRIDEAPKDRAAITIHNHPSPGAYGLSVLDVISAAEFGLYAAFVYNSDCLYGWYVEPVDTLDVIEAAGRTLRGFSRAEMPMRNYDFLARLGVSIFCWPWPETP